MAWGIGHATIVRVNRLRLFIKSLESKCVFL